MQVPTQEHQTETPITLFPEIDLKVYFRILWHWAWLIILCTVLAAVSAYIASSLSIPIYSASTTLLIDQADTTTDYQDIITSERIARTYAELMERRTVLRNVATELGVDSQALEDAIVDISVTPTRDTQLVTVDVEGTTPQIVTLVANYLPAVFIEELNTVQTQRFAESKASLELQLNDLRNQIERSNVEIDGFGNSRTADEEIRVAQLRDELAQYQSSYTALLSKYEDLRLAELQATDTITIVEEAEEPEAPIRPRVLVNTLLAAIVGGMLALGVIFLIEYLDDRIRTPQDLQTVIDAPILGTIARMGEGRRRNKGLVKRDEALITMLQPRHPIAESYRRLRTNLRFSSVNEPLRMLVLTSATPAEGKTTTSANLAATVAQAGHRVALVDADLREPQLHSVFQMSKGPGLTDALLSGGDVSFFLRDTEVPNLRVLTAGGVPPNPAELLGSKPMQRLLEQLQEQFDFVIIDAPPILAVTDAQILAGFTQGVLMVVNTTTTSRGLVASAATALAQVDARLLGVVLNQMTRSPRSYYYYDAYADYYAEDEGDEPKADFERLKSLEPAVMASRQPSFKDLAPAHHNDAYQVQQGGHKNGYYQLTPSQEDS